jgi:hypothetical protein
VLLVLIVYIISALSWGAILLQLSKAIIATIKNNSERPPLLIPLAVASLAIFIESAYFGTSAYFSLMGRNDIFMFMYQGQNWFLITILIAVSGVLLLFNLNINNKKGVK